MMCILESINNSDILIDVRSPDEFIESHIPGAINMPIFSNEEYQKIGTAYKQNAIKANFLGAKIACFNIAKILDNTDILNHKNKILIYCARGGNRSLSLYSVLKPLGLRVNRINGGYKAYRKMVLNYLENDINKTFITLCGNTGCGKTDIIKMASSWSINIEELCNHYGSAFGFLSGIQPTTKMFQNILYEELTSKDKILLIENESKKLGNIILPSALYDAYQNSTKILVECALEYRIKRIVNLYRNITEAEFISTMQKISPYMKKESKNDIIRAFNDGEKEKVAELLLVKYYDVKYKPSKHDYIINSDNIDKAYTEILNIKELVSKRG